MNQITFFKRNPAATNATAISSVDGICLQTKDSAIPTFRGARDAELSAAFTLQPLDAELLGHEVGLLRCTNLYVASAIA